MLNPADLPDYIVALKALVVASEGRHLRKQDRIDQLEKLVADFKRALFGARSEKTEPEQYELALEDIGGPPGYEMFVEAMADSKHPDHRNLKEWYGGSFDPNTPPADDLHFDVLKLAKRWKPNKTIN